jgi:hypothetical protein
MSENNSLQPRHAAVVWADLLIGMSVQDRQGRNLGVVKAVVSSPSGRLYRIGVRASAGDCRLRFLSAVSAELHLEYMVLQVDAPCPEHAQMLIDRSPNQRFRLFFDRRRRSLLRTL